MKTQEQQQDEKAKKPETDATSEQKPTDDSPTESRTGQDEKRKATEQEDAEEQSVVATPTFLSHIRPSFWD